MSVGPSLLSPIVVDVSSEDVGVVPLVPTTLSISFPRTTRIISLATNPVAVDTSVVLTATSGNTVLTATLTVLAPRVSEVTFQPDRLIGGASGTFEVTLNGPAPTTGLLVELKSDGPGVVVVPELAIVGPGDRSVQVPVATHPVDQDQEVNVRASHGGEGATAVLRVEAPVLASLELAPDRVTGGTLAEGMVTLTGQAPARGVLVELSSALPLLVDVPDAVRVPVGQTSARFVVATDAVGVETPVDILARQGPVEHVARLSLTPSVLASLSLSPGTVIGGQAVRGVVHLIGVAPSGGAEVGLFSDAPGIASLPASVTIPAGASSASFDLTTRRVVATTTVRLVGLRDGVAASAELRVAPAAKGDADGDGDIDLSDFMEFQNCLTRSGGVASVRCRGIFDFDNDDDVDLGDLVAFQGAYTGATVGRPIVAPVVVQALPVAVPELPGFDGKTPRPVACLADPDGGSLVEFVENELILMTNDAGELARFVARWNGEVLFEHDPSQYGLEGVRQHLVRIQTELADPSRLGDDLSVLAPNRRAGLLVSSRAGLEVLAAAAREAVGGSAVGVNWLGRGSDFRGRVTTEAPIGPGGYSTNTFDWRFLNAGSTQDIGVTEAWRALDLAGRLGNRVKLAILDMGFMSSDPDVPSGLTAISNVPFVSPLDVANLLNCGGPCPWHGTGVAHAAMGVPDNRWGGAGPAGPVAEPIYVFTLYDFFTGISAVAIARAAGARIINMSYSADVPAIFSWTVLPFEVATAAVRASGALLFAAAGNDGRGVDEEDCFLFACWEETLHTPCENRGVLCVGGLATNSRNRASNSNFGNGSVDLFAPYTVWGGPDPTTTGNRAVSRSGTSFASPYAAGVAALVWAADPSLSAGQVQDILYATAHSSPDRRVRRYVNAYDAVIAALGNTPPELAIRSPSDGAMFSRGIAAIYFAADASDVEDGVPLVTWRSHRDGVLGTGTNVFRNDLSLGTHTITATLTDSGGITVSDQVRITVVNDPPMVRIIEPLDNSRFFQGEAILFRGTSYDPNNWPSIELRNSQMQWLSNVAGRRITLGTGHVNLFGLTQGTYTIRLQGTDNEGATGTDSITLIVEALPPEPNFPPTVLITMPSGDTGTGNLDFQYDGFDTARGQWFKDVTLQGSAIDPEDGALSGASLVWRTDRTDLQGALLGTGTRITVRLYSDTCTGLFHEITLTVTDSAGNIRSRVRRIFIWLIC